MLALEGLAWNLPNSDVPILNTVSIRADMLYWGLFQWQQNQVVCLQSDQMGTFSDACAGLTKPTVVLGDGVARHQYNLESYDGLLLEGPAEALWPSAIGVGRAGIELIKKGELLPEGCTPRYIQPSYAEISKPLPSTMNFPGQKRQ